MKKIILILILIIVLGFVLYIYFSQPTEQDKIEQNIAQANYCQQKSDCVQLPGKCPFGCYVYVNINEADKINQLIKNYQSDCVYGCIEAPEYDCFNSQCQEILP